MVPKTSALDAPAISNAAATYGTSARACRTYSIIAEWPIPWQPRRRSWPRSRRMTRKSPLPAARAAPPEASGGVHGGGAPRSQGPRDSRASPLPRATRGAWSAMSGSAFFYISEGARDSCEAIVSDRPGRAVATRLRDRQRPALRGVPLGFAEMAFADDRSGADHREIGARRKLLRGEAPMVPVALAGPDGLGVLGADREDDGFGQGCTPDSSVVSSSLSDVPCAEALLDRAEVSRPRPLEEGERLLEVERFVLGALEVVGGLFGRDRLDLPREAEHAPERHQGALEMERRADDIQRARLDVDEIARRDLDRVSDGVARLLLEEDAITREAGGPEEIGHHRGLGARWWRPFTVASRRDDRHARPMPSELCHRSRAGRRRCAGRAVGAHPATNHDGDLGESREIAVVVQARIRSCEACRP